jgi:NadR type nicotinamide-nucleotide adenylyltransferase
VSDQAKRVVVFGPESTGKTTLAQRLAEYFGEPWAMEFVREYWESRGGVITVASLDSIARGQMANEDAAEAKARRVTLGDTDLLTCVLWDDVLFPGTCPAWVRAEAEARARRTDLFLLCVTDVPWEPDPQRCFPDEAGRERTMGLWRAALTERALPFVEIRGDWAERERAAIAAVEELLKHGRIRR